MQSDLTFDDLNVLLKSSFGLRKNERGLTFLVDLPTQEVRDNADWLDRRLIANKWFASLVENSESLPFESIRLCTYENVGSNNNDLPSFVVLSRSNSNRDALEQRLPLQHILETSSIVLAMTEFSATAPLKNQAGKLGFRGATLPGFTREMIPALQLDYNKVNDRVMQFKTRLDRATSCIVLFRVEGQEYCVYLDLRHRTAHASSGLIREDGVVANLPSGEAYIVPYEGERNDDPSKTSGFLPVQLDDEIVLYRIENNKAIEVITNGPASQVEKRKLKEEPSYGNMAELGFGVLGEWGVTAVGSILLDEKLGLHIAFGRSEHFGGVTGPASFRNPKNVIHIDRVYVPSAQPRIIVAKVELTYSEGSVETIMVESRYVA